MVLLYLSDPAPLGRAAAVVGDGGDVLDAGDLDAGVLDRADGGLAARPRALDLDVDLADAVLHGPAGRGLRGHLRRERRRLAGPLEAHVAGRGPRQDVAVLVGEADDRVVEARLDVSDAVADVLALALAGPAATGGLGLGHQVTTSSPSSCRRPSSSGPCGCVRWSGCAGRARAGRAGGAGLASSRSPSCA